MELMNQYNKKNYLYSQAIAENDMDLFRQFKNERNGFYRNLKKEKTDFFNKIFVNNNKSKKDLLEGEENLFKSNEMWANIKNLTNNPDSGTPQSLIINGNLVNKPKVIAEHANNFFISKIKKN